MGGHHPPRSERKEVWEDIQLTQICTYIKGQDPSLTHLTPACAKDMDALPASLPCGLVCMAVKLLRGGAETSQKKVRTTLEGNHDNGSTTRIAYLNTHSWGPWHEGVLSRAHIEALQA